MRSRVLSAAGRRRAGRLVLEVGMCALAAPLSARQAAPLPEPADRGRMSLEEVLRRRRSVRELAATPLVAREIGQLLWAAQGVTSPEGRRTAPSAGALYPLELYLATAAGVDRYEPAPHRLVRVLTGDRRSGLRAAALGQPAVGEAPAVFVIAAVLARTSGKYGARARRYVNLEAGHAAQNLLLQAVALGLAAVPIGAFDDAAVRRVLELPTGEEPLYLIPVGHPK